MTTLQFLMTYELLVVFDYKKTLPFKICYLLVNMNYDT